ncbi:unnamed protein product, partial [Owenia fusiformis]
GEEIMATYYKKKSRTVTPEQKKLLLEMFSKQPSPLFLKLLLDESLKWTSYMGVASIQVVSTIRQAIDRLFLKIETKFGHVLVSRALGYITLGWNGLSEIELEDALSCSDEVLNSVYQYHNPPVEGSVRIPSLLWARIKHDISEYLTERQSFGKNTVFWYHRQFIEAAMDRYTQGAASQMLHKELGVIYKHENGLRKTITLSKRGLTIQDANRQLT